MKENFHTQRSKENILKDFRELIDIFKARQYKLIAIKKNGAQVEFQIPLPNGSLVSIRKTVTHNKSFESNARSIYLFFAQKLWDLKRGSLTIIELINQIASNIELTKSKLTNEERMIVINSQSLLKGIEPPPRKLPYPQKGLLTR